MQFHIFIKRRNQYKDVQQAGNSIPACSISYNKDVEHNEQAEMLYNASSLGGETHTRGIQA